MQGEGNHVPSQRKSKWKVLTPSIFGEGSVMSLYLVYCISSASYTQ